MSLKEVSKRDKSIFNALKSGDFNVALDLLEDIQGQVQLPHSRTPLHYACQFGKLDIVKQLAATGWYSMTCQDTTGCTPLHIAAQHGCLEVVKYLVHERQCDPLCRDAVQQTPLHLACIHGRLSVVHYFVKTLGCNPEVKTGRKNTPLYLSARGGHLDVVKCLIGEAQCDPNVRNSSGHVPTHAASKSGHLGVLKHLLDTCHCNPQEKSDDGCTPLYCAALGGHLEVVEYLTVETACDPNCRNSNKFTPLHAASEKGHLDVVKFLVNSCNVSPEVTTAEGNTPLHFAAHSGHLSVVEFLIKDMECNLLPVNSSGHVPLHDASAGGRLEVVKYLVTTCEGDPKVTTPNLSTPLHFAAREGHLDVVKFFIQVMGCDPRCVNRSGHIPLHDASENGHLDVVKYFLLQCHCDPHVTTEEGNTPLHCAARNGHLKVASFLIEVGKCSPKAANRSGQLPLHFASENGHIDVVRYLTKKCRCNPYATTAKKNMPLHRAALGGHLEVVRFLIEEMKSRPERRNGSSHTPLHIACEHGHLDVVKYLVSDCGCDPQVRTEKNSTPLHRAARGGHLDVVKYLLNTCKCDPQVKTVKNSMPLHGAARGGHLQVVQFLVDDVECDVNCSNDAGQAPLHIASEHGHLDTVKYLVNTCRCDTEVKTADNSTPLQCAQRSGQQNVVSFFMYEIDQNGIDQEQPHLEDEISIEEENEPFESEQGDVAATDVLLSHKDTKQETKGMLEDAAEHMQRLEDGEKAEEELALERPIGGAKFEMETTISHSEAISAGDTPALSQESDPAYPTLSGETSSLSQESSTPEETETPSQESAQELAPLLNGSNEKGSTEEMTSPSKSNGVTDANGFHDSEVEDVSVPLLEEQPSLPGVLLSEPVTQETVTSDGKVIDLEEDAGISLVIPKHSVPKDQTVDLTIVTSFSGPFQDPEDVVSASPAYLIKSGHDVELTQDADMKLHHYANLQTQEDCDNMVFLESSSTPEYKGSNNTNPVYVFKKVENKRVEFSDKNRNLGVVKQRRFNLWFKIGKNRKDGEEDYGEMLYSARLYKAVKEDRIKAVFCMCPWIPQYGKYCDKVITREYSGMSKKAEGRSLINNVVITSDEVELVKSEPTAWDISMDISPPTISKMEIDLPIEANTAIDEFDDYPPRRVIELRPPVNNSAPAILKIKGLNLERSFQITNETLPGLTKVHAQLLEVETYLRETVTTVFKMEELLQDSCPVDPLLAKVQGISELSESVKKFAEEIQVLKEGVSEASSTSHDLSKLVKDKLHNYSGRTGYKPEPPAAILHIAEKLDQTRGPPKLRDISIVHNKHGQNYKLSEKIATEWHTIGLCLGIDHGPLRNIKEEERKLEDRLLKVLERWFDDAAGLPCHNMYPLSWKGLYNLLVNSRLSTHAKEFFNIMEHAL